jgi:hypothetical protein
MPRLFCWTDTPELALVPARQQGSSSGRLCHTSTHAPPLARACCLPARAHRHHDPLAFSQAALSDLLDAAWLWMVESQRQHPAAHHPFLL